MNRPAPSTGREKLLRTALFAASLMAGLGMVGTIEAAIRLTDPELMVRRRGLQRYHARLGWENRPNAISRDAGITVSIDAGGRRHADPDHANATGRGLLLLGDSVAFGLGVSDDDTFASSLSQGRPAYRVTNLAVPGYGPDQSLLSYERLPESIDAAVVVFALCLGNDLADVQSRSHLYDERIPKPRFVLRQGSLDLEDAQVRGARIRGLLDRSFLLAALAAPPREMEERPVEVENRLEALRRHSPEAEETLVAIVDRLRRRTEARGLRFLVVAFPDARTLNPGSTRWRSLHEKLARRAEVLDLVPVLAHDRESYERNTLDHIGHLSRRGHEQAARALRARLGFSGSS